MQIGGNANMDNNLQPNSYTQGAPASRSASPNTTPTDSDSWSDHTRLLAVQAAAIRFLAAWRASLAGNPKAWLAEATAAEKELVAALEARGLDVREMLRAATPKTATLPPAGRGR